MPAPIPARPPLTKGEARAARRAGAIGGGAALLGLVCMQLAVSLVVLPLIPVAALVANDAVWSLAAGAQAGTGPSPTTLQFAGSVLGGWFLSGMGVAIVIAVVLGLALPPLGLLLSVRLLRRGGTPRPIAITWWGLGISLLGGWVAVHALGALAALVLGAATRQGGGFDPLLLDRLMARGLDAQATLWLVAIAAASIVAMVALGALGWWWMAHVLRPSPAALLATRRVAPRAGPAR